MLFPDAPDSDYENSISAWNRTQKQKASNDNTCVFHAQEARDKVHGYETKEQTSD